MGTLGQLFRTKSIDAVVGETAREGASLKRVLGPVNLVTLGLGAIIGTGIFATIGSAYGGDASRSGAGPAIVVSFVVTSIVCGFTALCYAEFASMVPVAGSAYTYGQLHCNPRRAGRGGSSGWDLLLEYAIAANTAVAISWAAYADALLRGLGVELPRWLVTDFRTARGAPDILAAAPHVFGVPIVFNALALGIVFALTVILVWGVRESARFNAVMVAVKLLVIAFFVLACTKYVQPAHWRPFAPNGFRGIASAAAVVFFAYIGFDAVSTCAEECRNPGRDMPISAFSARSRFAPCSMWSSPRSSPGSRPIQRRGFVRYDPARRAEALAVAMEYAHMPAWAVGIVALGSVVAQTAVLFVFQLGQPRILLAMARDGLLPPVFARVHPRFRTPHVATIATGVLVAVVSAFANIDEMVDLTNIGTLFAFILVCIGITIMRLRDPERARPFRVPFGPWLVPAAGVASCLFLVFYLPPSSWLRFFAWFLVGIVFYWAYGYRHSRVARTRLP